MTTRNATRHECACPRWPDCHLHGAREFGGGEPDVCESHQHFGPVETPDEAAARRAIAAVLDPLESGVQRRIVRRVQDELQSR